MTTAAVAATTSSNEQQIVSGADKKYTIRVNSTRTEREKRSFWRQQIKYTTLLLSIHAHSFSNKCIHTRLANENQNNEDDILYMLLCMRYLPPHTLTTWPSSFYIVEVRAYI